MGKMELYWKYLSSSINKRCPQLIKDENNIDAQYSKNLVPPGRQGAVGDKIQGP
jgi:hypothetical protein